ncbi:hypothetical protein [Streptococcus suis]|uniref:hypothetical protein n=1 Tax=Streptococcus suis TaxID=1307 RepID=UPI00147830D2
MSNFWGAVHSQAYLIYDHQLPVGLIMYHDSPQVQAYHLSEFFIDKHYRVRAMVDKL